MGICSRATAAVAVLTLVLIGLVAPGFASEGGETGSAAAAALEKIKGLAGTWEGTASRGGKVRLEFELVGDGTAVLERLQMMGEKTHHNMATMYHLDGDSLFLTHYCAVGNQPRMRASGLEGQSVRFEFVDATNLASADAGHMHRAVITFQDDDRLTADWTWFEKGEAQFTESIQVRRVASRAKTESH